MKSRRGASLTEAIFAIFILATGALACFTLLSESIRHQGQSQRVSDGLLLAESTLEEARLWGAVPANFDSDWSTWTASPRTDARYPGYAAAVQVSNLAEAYSTTLVNCTRSLKVVVTLDTRQVVTLNGVVASPTRDVTGPPIVELVSGPATLGANQTSIFQATLQDSSNHTVPGVSFDWDQAQIVQAPATVGGRGTLVPVAPNQVKLVNDLNKPGKLNVIVKVRYQGVPSQGTSVNVTMLP